MFLFSLFEESPTNDDEGGEPPVEVEQIGSAAETTEQTAVEQISAEPTEQTVLPNTREPTSPYLEDDPRVVQQ